MGIMTATVISRDHNKVMLETQRTGSCSGCPQTKTCAIVGLNDERRSLLYLESDTNEFKQGDNVNVHCNDNLLLQYVSILFLPSLFLIISINLLSSFLAPNLSLTMAVLIQFLLPLCLGFLSSRTLLKVSAVQLNRGVVLIPESN